MAADLLHGEILLRPVSRRLSAGGPCTYIQVELGTASLLPSACLTCALKDVYSDRQYQALSSKDTGYDRISGIMR